ncbi:unnamed protein product, partial [Ectocarpus sp. 8 AP-2014]
RPWLSHELFWDNRACTPLAVPRRKFPVVLKIFALKRSNRRTHLCIHGLSAQASFSRVPCLALLCCQTHTTSTAAAAAAAATTPNVKCVGYSVGGWYDRV